MYCFRAFNANEIFKPCCVKPPELAPLRDKRLRKRERGKRVGGCGIYSIYYRNDLIYVGKFLGTKTDPLAGDICSVRWNRHLLTITMRGEQVSAHPDITAEFEGCELAHENDLLNIDHKDRGYVTSYNRIYFASQNWTDLKGRDYEKILSKFDFVYAQYCNDTIGAVGNVIQIRRKISQQEFAMICRLKPICNNEINVNYANTETVEGFKKGFHETRHLVVGE